MFDNSIKAQALLAECNVAAPIEGLGTVVHKTPCVLKAVMDFAVLGGAVGDLSLVDDQGNPAVLPQGAIVTKVLAYVVAAVTSGGSATVALKAANAADLMTATAKASLSLAAKLDGVPDGTAANAVGPLAADTRVKATVGTAALTAGKVQYFIHYVIS